MKQLLILLLLCSPLFGQTYISQSGGTQNCTPDGSSSQSTTALASVTWSTSGDYRVCGILTNPLTVGASGTSGSPLYVRFETGAGISLGVCNTSGCLNVANKSWVIVDGAPATVDTACGWVANAQVACNGTIQMTASGTAFGNGATSAYLVEGTGCQNCEIRNLNLINTYVRTGTTDTPGGNFRAVDQAGTTTSGVYFKVHNNILHDSADGFDYIPGNSNDTGMYYYNNYSYNMGAHGNVANNNNGTINQVMIHDNYFGSTSAWDSSGCFNHHNSFHIFSYTQTASNIYYYNNQTAGNWGNCPTSEAFFEGSGSLIANCYVYNNFFGATYSQENNGVVSFTCSGTNYLVNNTLYGDFKSGDSIANLNGSTNWTVLNNGFDNGHTLVFTNGGQPYTTSSNNNVYGGQSADPWGINCGGGCTYYATLAAWRTGCSCDSAAVFSNTAGYLNINTTTGTPNTGSPLLNAGANETSLSSTLPGITSDLYGNSRPSSGSWNAGAVQGSGSTYTITVSSITGNGLVTSSDSVLSCGTGGSTPPCTDLSASGTVTLTFTPSSGYTLSNATGCTLSGNTCSVTTTATITATFTAIPPAPTPAILMSGNSKIFGSGVAR